MPSSIVQSFAVSGGPLGPVSFTSTGDLGGDLGTVAVNNATTGPLPVAFATAKIKSIFLYSDGDLTLHTNAANGAGGQNFSIKSGIPFFWTSQMGTPNPFNTAVTAGFWFENAANTNTNVYGLLNQIL